MSAHVLCSLTFTFGIEHVDDVPDHLVPMSSLMSVITIHENETFLEQLKLE
jgi:hypothetical protein